MNLRIGLSVMVLAAAVPVAAQREPVAAGSVREAPEILRDLALERSVATRARGLDASLRPSARSKIALASKAVLAHLAYAPGEPDPLALALAEVRTRFGQLNAQEADLACFLVMAEMARILADPDELARNLAVGDLGGERSLRLQMHMDRRSRLMQTLSNVLQRLSGTSDVIAGNLK